MWKLETLYSFHKSDVIVANKQVFLYNIVHTYLPDALYNENLIKVFDYKDLELAKDIARNYNKGVLL